MTHANGVLCNGQPQPDKAVVAKYAKDVQDASKRIRMSVELVTPERAKDLLALQQKNRRPSNSRIEKYARAVRDGRWQITGEAIILDERGRPLNGQHRLLAIVMSGVSAPAVIISGVLEEAFVSMDQGKLRGFADVLSIEGHDSCSSAASAMRWAYVYFNHGFDSLWTGNGPDNDQLYEFAESHPKIGKSVEFVKANVLNKMPIGIFAFCHYICARKHAAEANTFFESILSATNIKPGSPEFLVNRLIGSMTTRTKAEMVHLAAIVIKAWNASVRGERPLRLRWVAGVEDFPKVA